MVQRKLSSKSQIKFSESIGVILIVYLIIIAGLYWYNEVHLDSLRELTKEDNRLRSIETYNFVVNTDLLRLSQESVVEGEIDLLSLEVFHEFSQTEEGYEYLEKKLGNAQVNLTLYKMKNSGLELDPVDDGKFEIYTKWPEDVLDEEIFRSVVPIINSSSKEVFIGILEIKVPLVTAKSS
ncbi:hypothetical protein H6501_02760 [Candidatus Woesearchaeota archaeon]|nr:hypothetical protein [Nanoarchaeota archaeon]MCB9370492.1 hypothetical protein [Candidatus Woesearchaeota archaeon]USN43570.1 MAG: hypothetical protein H6500_04205 [Candidatus Woesearchaeota archaeon]